MSDDRESSADAEPRFVSAREGYDRWAESYDSIDNPLVAMASLAREPLAPAVAGARVLEIGCGTGRNQAFFLQARAREYVGVDASEGMLRRARELPVDDRCRWVAADVRRPLPEDLRGFDLVVFCLTLEHVEDLTPVFRHCAAAAHEAGQLQVYELHAGLRAEGVRAHFRADDREHYVPSFPHSPLEYRTALADAGWQVATITEWFATMESCRRSPKLRKHLGKPVLIDLSARRG